MILGQKRLQSSTTDTLVASIPSNKVARRVTLANRDTNPVLVTLYVTPKNYDGPPDVPNEVLSNLSLKARNTILINEDEFRAEFGEQIWAKGTSATLDLVVTVMD